MIFLFFGERGKRGKGFRVTNVNWGLGRGCTRWGDKSGIWRFYKRVWKNIFYERRDKERERGVLGMEGDFWVMYGKERYTKYVVIKVN